MCVRNTFGTYLRVNALPDNPIAHVFPVLRFADRRLVSELVVFLILI
jgi:hypothetical protein